MPGAKQGALKSSWAQFLRDGKQGVDVHSVSRSTDRRQKEGTMSTDTEPFQASPAARGANSNPGAAVPEGKQTKSREVCRT